MNTVPSTRRGTLHYAAAMLFLLSTAGCTRVSSDDPDGPGTAGAMVDETTTKQVRTPGTLTGTGDQVEDTEFYDPITLRVVIDDPSPWHTYPPGVPFNVDVRIEGDDLDGAQVVCRWVDATRRPISGDIPITAVPRAIQSPSTGPGFYGLEFTSTNPRVAFSPQPPGFPSSIHGFAVIPEPPAGTPMIDRASPFGIVQANPEDPYLRSGSGPRVTGVHLKTKTWRQSAGSWSNAIAARAAAGHTEMPLVNNDPWDSDGDRPITPAQLDEIGSRYRAVLSASPSLVEFWQVGVEENGGQPYEEPYHFSNLAAKIARLRFETNQVNPQVRHVYNTRGDDMAEFDRLFASGPFKNFYSGLAQNPYRWPDFPTPETWLVDHVVDLRARMDAAGRTQHFLWFGELGIPARGHNDPTAFFGYPASGDEVPGASLHYAATYLVKCHALALSAGVQRIYVYNYKNRGDDINYAEHHFGLRSFSGPDEDPGHPLPAYVAYINMLSHLKGSRFVAHTEPLPGVQVFEFAVTGTSQWRVLAWVHPEATVTVPLSAFSIPVQSVTDLYGAPVPVVGGQFTLGADPIYLRF